MVGSVCFRCLTNTFSVGMPQMQRPDPVFPGRGVASLSKAELPLHGTSIPLFRYPGWGGSTVRADPAGKYGPARLLWETRGELASCNKKAAPSPGTADKTNYDEPAIAYCTLPGPGKFFVRHIQAGLLAQALSQLPPSQGSNAPVAYGNRIANTATALRGILTRFPFNAPKRRTCIPLLFDCFYSIST